MSMPHSLDDGVHLVNGLWPLWALRHRWPSTGDGSARWFHFDVARSGSTRCSWCGSFGRWLAGTRGFFECTCILLQGRAGLDRKQRHQPSTRTSAQLYIHISRKPPVHQHRVSEACQAHTTTWATLPALFQVCNQAQAGSHTPQRGPEVVLDTRVSRQTRTFLCSTLVQAMGACCGVACRASSHCQHLPHQ